MNLRPRIMRCAPALVAVLALSACRADITYRFDIHPDQTVTTTLRYAVDDQLYAMMENSAAQSNQSSIFDQPPDGWSAARSVDADGNHVIVLKRTMPLAELQGNPDGLPHPSIVKIPAWSTNNFETTVGLFHDHHLINLSVPALMDTSEVDSSNPYTNAAIGMASGIIGIHLQVKGPWKVIRSNGEMTPDGATQWDLNLAHPTHIAYAFDTLDVTHVAIAVAGAFLAIVALTIFYLRRRAPRSVSVQ